MGLLGLWALGAAPSSFSRSEEAVSLGWALAPIRIKLTAKPKGSSGRQGYPLLPWAPSWGTGSFWGPPWFWIEAVSPSDLQNKVTQGSGLLPGSPLVWDEGSGASAKGCCLDNDTNESQCLFEFLFPNYSAVMAPFSARLGWGLGVGSGGFGEACGPRPAKDQATSPSWLLNS